MSMMNMVAKMAVGFAVAKGMQQVQKSGGLGKIMESLSGAAGGARGGTSSAGGLGGLGDIMGSLTGGSSSGAAGGLGGLGDILGGLTKGAGGAATSGMGGLGDILGGLTGGAGGAAAGGLGGLGGLLGGLANARTGASAGSLEDLLGQDNPAEEPAEEDTAGLMVRAMVMAARSDGEIDATEKETLMATIGEDASAEDMAFVREALNAPVDAAALAADTPKGVETQVYSMSVMAIEPSNQAEAKFLHELATSLGIRQATANEIHDSFGVPRLYS